LLSPRFYAAIYGDIRKKDNRHRKWQPNHRSTRDRNDRTDRNFEIKPFLFLLEQRWISLTLCVGISAARRPAARIVRVVFDVPT
jgi:hypothetical protein